MLASGETVREVLEDMTARYPSLEAQLFEQGELTPFVNVYVGRDDVRTLEGLDTLVSGNAVILLPAMAGGRSETSCGTPGWRLLSVHRDRAHACSDL